MNLKLVVASMSILGLVSCPVFAATHAKKKHHKKHHHHMVKHHKMERETVAQERREERMEERHEYKDMAPACIDQSS